MRAVIIATGFNLGVAALNERHPTPLLPLVDRAFIQHMIEALVERGVSEFDFVLHHLPEKIENALGNGTRWGCQFRFHLARQQAHPYNWLKTLESAQEPILLAHADCLPFLSKDFELPDDFKQPLWYGTAEGRWTGWAVLPPAWAANLPVNLTKSALEQSLCEQGRSQTIHHLLKLDSYEGLLAAQASVLDKHYPEPLLGGHEAEPGIWISRNVTLPPTARLIAPVFIGENCRIGQGVQLGPHAVIGHNCVLDERCTVTNSMVFSGSFVGAALELEDVIVDKNLLVNARLGAAIPVADDFILGSLAEMRVSHSLRGLWSRLSAAAMLLLLWPVLLLTALWLKLTRRGPVLYQHEAIQLPAPEHHAQWRTVKLYSFQAEPQHSGGWSDLFLRVLPGLLNVVQGKVRFVGVSPRAKADVQTLTPDWQALYLRTKAGLITEAEVQYGAHADEDELYSAEAFYAATATLKHDLLLLWRYLGRLVLAPLYPPTATINQATSSE